jgi:hypothetical protein
MSSFSRTIFEVAVFRVAALLLATASLVSVAPTSANAADDAGFRHTLFNGQNLEGWQVYGCDAAVENGLIVLKGGNGWLRAQQLYTDFVLDIDWRALKSSDYDSGIYIRAEMPKKAGQQFPSRYQVNLKQGDEGNIKNLKGATSTGLVKPGAWNHFRIIVVGDTAELEINGKPAWKAAGLENREGFIGIQSEVALGGQYEFRNIVVTELDFHSLLNGSDLTGWHVSSQTGHSRKSGNKTGGRWVLEEGAIVGSQDEPGNGGIILTDKAFKDFEVAIEMKNDFGPDSGLFLRSNDKGQAYQYLVDYHSKGNLAGIYGEGLTGKIHDRNFDFLDDPAKIVPHESKFPLPISPEAWPAFWHHGQWNELRARIVANPPRITTWINGVRFMEYEDTEKRHQDAGSIALQVHGGGDLTRQFVRYRNIRVKALD